MTENNTKQQDLRALEAILFASTEPMSTNALRERFSNDKDIGGLLLELQSHYEKRGFQLVNMNGHWAFRTASDLSDFLAVEKDVQRKLSRAAMETLAIIAYHQPITRAEIENIRGVATSKGTLDVLIECSWVKPGRRRETPGRPLTWVTTTEFMDQFGLESMNDLPGLDELKASGLLDRRPAVENISTGDLFEKEEDDLDADLEQDEAEQDEAEQSHTTDNSTISEDEPDTSDTENDTDKNDTDKEY